MVGFRRVYIPSRLCYIESIKIWEGDRMSAKSILIADTTKQERIEIIRRWIPADEALDESDIDLWEFYDDYIQGKKEISECNAAFQANF